MALPSGCAPPPELRPVPTPPAVPAHVYKCITPQMHSMQSLEDANDPRLLQPFTGCHAIKGYRTQ